MKSNFVRSSKKTPCPVCGRTKDADCAWTKDLILCHQSDSNQTIASLRIGDVINADGQKWALVKVNAGFSGKAAVFRPHREGQEKSVLTYQQMQSAQVVQVADRQEAVEESMHQLVKAIDKTLEMAPIEYMLDEEIKMERDLAHVALEEAKGMVKELTLLARNDAYFVALLDEFQVKVRQLHYQHKDLTEYCDCPRKYWENYLL